VASGQIELRKLDGFDEISKVLGEQRRTEVKSKPEKTSEKKAAA